jgi:hypothetical protein
MVRDLLIIGFFALILSGMVIGIWRMVDTPVLNLPSRRFRKDSTQPGQSPEPEKK